MYILIDSNSAIFFIASLIGFFLAEGEEKMGACGSKPNGCVGIKGRKLVRRRKHKVSRRRNVSKTHSSASQNLSKIEPSDHSYSNPAFQGITTSRTNHDSLFTSKMEDSFSVSRLISPASSI